MAKVPDNPSGSPNILMLNLTSEMDTMKMVCDAASLELAQWLAKSMSILQAPTFQAAAAKFRWFNGKWASSGGFIASDMVYAAAAFECVHFLECYDQLPVSACRGARRQLPQQKRCSPLQRSVKVVSVCEEFVQSSRVKDSWWFMSVP